MIHAPNVNVSFILCSVITLFLPPSFPSFVLIIITPHFSIYFGGNYLAVVSFSNVFFMRFSFHFIWELYFFTSCYFSSCCSTSTSSTLFLSLSCFSSSCASSSSSTSSFSSNPQKKVKTQYSCARRQVNEPSQGGTRCLPELNAVILRTGELWLSTSPAEI